MPVVDSTVNVTDCFAKGPGETCTLRCIYGYVGEASLYTCTASTDGEVFVGTPPSCVQSTTTTFTATTTSSTTSLTTTVTVLVRCTDGIPSGVGVNATDCFELYNGQSCNATCVAPFEGGPIEYVCDPSTASLTGPELTCKLKECEVSQLPSNLSTDDCVGKVVGEFCTLSCPLGYTGQEELLECTETGAFSGAQPSCELLACEIGNLPVLPGVDISGCLNLFAGSNCSVTCDVGYEGAPSSYVCDLYGIFNGSAPSCSPKSCSVPSYLEGNSSFNASSCYGLFHGQTCLSECMVGYAGLPSQHLCSDGTLLGAAPSCTPEPCTFEGFALGVALDPSPCSGTTSGQSCHLQCVQGYELVGDGTLTCQAETGTFTSSSASCEPAKCGNLSTLSVFASAGVGDSCSNLVFGQGCFAFCQQGYQLDGNVSLMQCADAGTSSAGFVEVLEGGSQLAAVNSSGPSCTAKPCTAGVPNLRGATHDCEGKVTGETCTISAELGFILTGPSTLTCQADGSFTQDLPTIEAATCADPTFETGVGSTCDNKTIGADCWAYCLSGYSGTPKAYRCQANVTANAVQIEPLGDAVVCVSTGSGRRLSSSNCLDSSAVVVGLSTDSFTHDCTGKANNDACVAHCSLGWNMTETEPSIFTCQNGALVGASLPTCTAIPCTFAFPNALGVLHTCDGVVTGQTCIASCTEAGFNYSAGQVAESFTCLATGSLSGTSPTCERITCPDLQLESQYLHNCQGQRFQDTCEVGCGQGYSLSGSSSRRECQADGSFSGGLPTCVGNPCDQTLPDNPTVNSTSCNGLVTGQSCEATCADGFLPGNASLTCDASGYILGTMPSCKPLTCADKSWAASFRSTCSGTTYGSKCAVYCAPGYTSSGVQEWQCAWADGQVQLQGTLPTCEPQACTSGLPADSSSVTSNCSTVTTGETCLQTCADGYTYSASASPSVWTCQEDGAASGSSTSCQAIGCDTALVATGMAHTCAGIVFGASCFAFCDVGYTSSNAAVTSQRWHCAGSSAGSLVPGLTETDGVGLRGTLPSCSPLPCLYNLPVGAQYDHNCSTVGTGETCVVGCASSFYGIPESRTCNSNRLLEGALPVCILTSTTITSTTSVSSTQTITTTSTVTTLPFLCTPGYIPWVQGAGNFSCFGELGIGQRCVAPCADGGPQAVIVCWTNRQWQLQEACHTEDASPLIPILVVTLSIMCALVLFSGAGLYCFLKTPKTAPIEVEPSAGAKSPKSPLSMSPTSPISPGRIPPQRVPVDMPQGASYAWMNEARRPIHPMDLDLMTMDTLLSPQHWQPSQPPTLPSAPIMAPHGYQQSLSFIALDEMFAGTNPPMMTTYRRPPAPDTVVQVEDDPSFRVWVQH